MRVGYMIYIKCLRHIYKRYKDDTLDIYIEDCSGINENKSIEK